MIIYHLRLWIAERRGCSSAIFSPLHIGQNVNLFTEDQESPHAQKLSWVCSGSLPRFPTQTQNKGLVLVVMGTHFQLTVKSGIKWKKKKTALQVVRCVAAVASTSPYFFLPTVWHKHTVSDLGEYRPRSNMVLNVKKNRLSQLSGIHLFCCHTLTWFWWEVWSGDSENGIWQQPKCSLLLFSFHLEWI